MSDNTNDTPKPDYVVAREELAALIAAHHVTIDALFVPWSKSRHAKPQPRMDDRSLNWSVRVLVNGRIVLTCDYTQGIAYCPSYKALGSAFRRTLENAERIAQETETGYASRGSSGMLRGKQIELSAVDVLSSLMLDAEAIEYASFEDWADNYGYDKDSREAEKTYRECLSHGLALRAALGDAALTGMRNAAQRM